MSEQIAKDATSQTIEVFIKDSSSTTGAGLTGLAYNTAGLTAYYYRQGAASATAITLATMTLGTWATGGFVVVDGTNCPGLYQLGVPNAALATGANYVDIYLKGATNMVQTVARINLVTEVTFPTNFSALSINASGHVSRVTLADTLTTYTGNTVQTGDSYARLGAPVGASTSADIAEVQTDINTLLSQVANIAAVGTSINVVAESYTLTTGTQTSGTYASTALLDATPHTHTDAAGTLDLYYQFDIGVQGLPSSVGVTAYANGASDDLAIQAYNWGTTTFETVGTLVGKSGATYDSGTYTLLTRHVGTGANVGKVRIRFYSAALTSATLRVDQIFVSYSQGQVYQYAVGIVSAVGGTTTSFQTNLTQADNFWNDALLIFTSGTLAGQSKPIQDFANTNGVITLDEALTSAPTNGDAFVIKAEHIHPISQIADGVLLRKLDRTGQGTDVAQERTVVNALRAIRNKAGIAGGVLTVTKEDDATTAWTAAVTTTAGNPISEVDPS